MKIEVSKFNVHWLIAVVLLIATKYFEDFYYDNKRWAEVAGLASVDEINRLERHFLLSLNYKLFISQEELEETRHKFR